MESSTQQKGLAKLVESLHDPLRMRLACTGIMLTIGYLGIYSPLHAQLEECEQQLKSERQLQQLAQQVDALRQETSHFENRIPEYEDPNEWVQYVLAGTRQFSVKLKQMDSKKSKRVGPYEALALELELEGPVHELSGLLHWLESNAHLFRIDALKATPVVNDHELRVMKMTLLGLKD